MNAKDCVKEFQLECELRRLSARTIRGYHNNVMLFLNFIEKHDAIDQIEDIRPIHIKQYVQYLLGKKLTASYANGIIKCLRAYFKFAHQEEYICINPTQKVNWQREPKVLIQTFHDEEVRGLMNAFDYSTYLSARNKMILAIAFDTGARNTEICEIKKRDVRETMILIHGKGNKERNVPISPALRRIMCKYERIRDYYFDDKILRYDNYLLSRTGCPLTISKLRLQ